MGSFYSRLYYSFNLLLFQWLILCFVFIMVLWFSFCRFYLSISIVSMFIVLFLYVCFSLCNYCLIFWFILFIFFSWSFMFSCLSFLCSFYLIYLCIIFFSIDKFYFIDFIVFFMFIWFFFFIMYYFSFLFLCLSIYLLSFLLFTLSSNDAISFLSNALLLSVLLYLAFEIVHLCCLVYLFFTYTWFLFALGFTVILFISFLLFSWNSVCCLCGELLVFSGQTHKSALSWGRLWVWLCF